MYCAIFYLILSIERIGPSIVVVIFSIVFTMIHFSAKLKYFTRGIFIDLFGFFTGFLSLIIF